MTVHRYFLLSETHRAQLTQRVTSACRAWSDTWRASPVTAGTLEKGLTVDPPQAWSTLPSDGWRAAKIAERIVAWIHADDGEAGTLLDVVAGGCGDRAGDLANRMGWKLIADFCARIYGVDAGTLVFDAAKKTKPDNALFASGGDAVAVTMRLDGFELRLLMLGDSFKGFAPGPTARKTAMAPLTPLSKAIDGQAAAITVTLEVPGGVLLDDIGDLAEGHVLMLDQAPWAEWTLLGPSDTRLGRCRPGRVGDRFAVQLVAASKP